GDFKREFDLAAGGDMKTGILFFDQIWLCIGLVVALGVVCGMQAQGGGPKFIVDPSWPRPLPQNWANGQVSGVCVDAQDNVFIVNRNDITDKEAEIAQQAPPFIEFDPDGNVVNSFGDWKVVPNITHGCFIDSENNFGRLAMAMESSKNTVTTENY